MTKTQERVEYERIREYLCGRCARIAAGYKAA
jgi:hypothetical protein